MLDAIKLVISTVWREENYLEATLASLSVEHPTRAERGVSLVVGTPVTAHLDQYRSCPGVTVVEMGPNTWSWIKSRPLTQRASWNYYRSLTHNTDDERGRLILEDDVRFARGWQPRLSAILSELHELHGSGFVLAIYSPWDLVLQEHSGERFYAEYPLEKFYGTQGVYYTAVTRKGFAKYLKVHGMVANEKGYDYLLRDYLSQAGLPLFAATPSLIQHMGKKSTGLGSWHDAPGFVEDLESETQNGQTQTEQTMRRIHSD